MRSILFALLLTSCASGPSEFHKGATPTRAPSFNPTTDAPHTVGHPGHLRPEALPRSPHTRVLPQTPETHAQPGLWATKASADEAHDPPEWMTRPPIALGWHIPLLMNDREEYLNDVFQYPIRRCAAMIDEVVRTVIPHDELAALSGDERRCVVALLNSHCLMLDLKRIEEARALGRTIKEETKEWLNRRASSATQFTKEACTRGDKGRIKPVVQRAQDRWHLFERRPAVTR